MQRKKGNVWHLVRMHLDLIVVPTVIGYTKRGDGVMGKGLAKQAANRYPSLESDYGELCKKHGEDTPVTVVRPKPKPSLLPMPRLILFPTKPLNKNFPFLSWQNQADFALVDRSLGQLRQFILDEPKSNALIFIPDVGCGYGRLKTGEIRPLIDKHLGEFSNVVHVVYQKK